MSNQSANAKRAANNRKINAVVEPARLIALVKRSLALGLSALLTLQPVIANAQSVSPSSTSAAANRPGVGAAPNGKPLVDIVTPNGQGLSHNKYDDFNVGTPGLILNNYNAEVGTSHLGGATPGNPNLRNSGPANVILNEVTTTNRTQLDGPMEVFGGGADVIVANPNGITCDGCGFINTPHATLTTGTPDIGGDGRLEGFTVRGGDVTFGSKGGNFAADPGAVDLFDVVSRSISVNGPVFGKDLRLTAGRNKFNYATGEAAALEATSGTPEFAIDGSDLGAMQANRIKMVVTEKGAGVRMSGNMAANTNELSLSSDGKISIGQASGQQGVTIRSNASVSAARVTSKRSVAVQAASGISLQSISAEGDIAFSAGGGLLTVAGEVTSLGTVQLSSGGGMLVGSIDAGQAASLASASGSIQVTVRAKTTGALSISAVAGAISATSLVSSNNIGLIAGLGIGVSGDILAAGNVAVSGQSFSSGSIVSGIDFAATQADPNGKPVVGSAGSLQLKATGGIVSGGLQSAGATDIAASSLTAQSLTSHGKIDINATSDFGGQILGSGDVNISGQGIKAAAIASGVDFSASEKAGGNIVLARDGNLTLTASGGAIDATEILAAGDLNATAATIKATDIIGRKLVTLSGSTNVENQILGAGDVHISGQTVNAGSIVSGADIDATNAANGTIILSNSGSLTLDVAGGNIAVKALLSAGDLNAEAATLVADSVTSHGNIGIDSSVDISGQLLAAANVALAGRNISAGLLASGVDFDASNASNGAIVLATSGDLGVDATGGTVTAGALLSAGKVDVTSNVLTAQKVTGHGNVAIAADTNVSGQIVGGGNVGITGPGIRAGVIVSGVDFAKTDQSPSGDFVLGQAGDLALTATSNSINAGNLQAAGNLVANAKQDIAANAVAHQAMSMTALGAINLSGQSISAGNIDLKASSISADTLVSGMDFAASAASPTGSLMLDRSGTMTLAASGGSITANNLLSGGDLSAMAAQNIGYQSLQSMSAASLNAVGGSISIDKETRVAGDITLATQSLDFSNNRAKIATGKTLTVKAGTATFAGSNMTFGGLDLKLSGTANLTNAQLNAVTGSGGTGNIGIAAAGLTTTGATAILAANDLTLTLPSLTNSAQLAAGHDLAFNIAGDLTNKQTGLIYAGNDATLLVGSNLLNDQGAIIAGHNMTIAGAAPDQKNRAITNVSGLIQSGGDMSMLTENLTNKRLETPTVTRNVLVSSNTGFNFSLNPEVAGKPYAYLETTDQNMFQLYPGVDPPLWSEYEPKLWSVAESADGTTYHAWTWISGVGPTEVRPIFNWIKDRVPHDGNGNPILDPNNPPRYFIVDRVINPTGDTSTTYSWDPNAHLTQSTYEDQFTAALTPEAKIHAGGDLTVDAGTLNNSYSTIEAAGNATLSGSVLNNEGVALARTTTTSCNADGPCQAFDAAGNRNPSKDIANGTSIVSGTDVIGSAAGTIKAGKILDTNGYATVNNTAGAGSMASSATLAAPGASSNPLTALNGLTAGAALFDISASLAKLSPDAATASVVGNILIAKLTVALGGASLADYVRVNGQAMAALARPQSGGAGGTIPGQTFLFETRAAYLDVGKFYGSSYFISRIGYRPENTIPFLGDAYFENQLIDEQMRQLSGEGLGLNSFVPGSDAIAQMKTLLDNGIAYAQAHDLPLGGGLSPQQATELTQSMVIYQTQTIGGAEVIAPVFYMAAADSRKVKVAGAMLSGETVSMKVGTLNNSGAVAASGNLHIVAASIKADGGSFNAGGDLKMASAGALILTTQSLNIGGVAMVNPSGGAHAGGNLSLSAKDDLTLSGVKVTAGKDATLSGKNVTLEAVKTANGGQQNATGAELSAGGNAVVIANDNVNIIGSGVKAGGSLGIGAENGSVNVVTTDLARKTASDNGKTTSTDQLQSQLSSGGSTTITSGDGILISGSSVKAGGDVALSATHDMNITPSQSQASTSLSKGRATSSSSDITHQGSEITSGGSVSANAGHDLNVIGSKIAGDTSVNLHAANNVTIGDVTDTETSDYHDKKKGGLFGGGHEQTTHTETDTVVGSSISGKTGVTITSGKNTTVSTSKITAGDADHKADLNIVTGGDLIIASGKDVTAVDDKSKKSGILSKKTTSHSGFDETTVASDLGASGNINLDAGKAAIISGSKVKAGGALAITGDSVAVIGAEEDHSRADRKTKSGLFAGSGDGFFSLYGKNQNDKTGTTTRNVGSSLSSGVGQDITIVARETDVDVFGSAISAGRNFVVDAARDVNVMPGAETSDATSLNKRSGFGLQVSSGSGSASIGIGVGKATDRSAQDQSTNAPSSLSAGHDILITAGRDANLQAAKLSADHDARVIAVRDVNLLSAQDQSNYRELHEQYFTGVTLEVSSSLVSAASNTAEAASRIGDGSASKSVAFAAIAGINAYSALASVRDAANNKRDRAPLYSVGLTAGFQASKSTAAGSSSTPVPTIIRAGNSVFVEATSGNLTSHGAQLVAGYDADGNKTGGDGKVGLWAGKSVLLESAQATTSNTSKNTSGGVAVNLDLSGAKFNFATGGANGSSVTQLNTHVLGTGEVDIHSGGDTVLKGATVTGKKVKTDIGGDLIIESLLDTASQNAKQLSISGGIGSGGFGLSGTYQKAKGDAAVVSEQSGIHAGSDGFDIDVAGKTALIGGVITSEAPAEKNKLSTGTLEWSDLDTHSTWKADTYGGGFSSAGPSVAPHLNDGEKKTGEAFSAISPGQITITDPANQTQDIGTLRRDTVNTNTSLPGIPELQKVLSEQYTTQSLYQDAAAKFAKVIGDAAAELEKAAIARGDTQAAAFWAEGGPGRAGLHALAGGLLGGVTDVSGMVSGALGGASSALLAPEIHKLVANMVDSSNIADPKLRELLINSVTGGLLEGLAASAGGSTGAAYAGNAYQNNYLTHKEREEFTRTQANCDSGDKSACEHAEELRTLSKSRDQKIGGCVGNSSAECITARADLRIAAAEYLDAALTGEGDHLDALSLLERHMVFLDAWKYADDSDPKDNQEITSAKSRLTSDGAKALLTGSKDEISQIIREPIIIGAIAFGGAGNAKGIVGEGAEAGGTSSGAARDGIDGASPKFYDSNYRTDFYDAEGNPVKWRNPLTNQIEDIPLGVPIERDHIFPTKEVVNLPGFAELSAKQKDIILNEPQNLQPLPKSFNCSKGCKVENTDSPWVTFKDQVIDPDYSTWLGGEQREMRLYLMDRIKVIKPPGGRND